MTQPAADANGKWSVFPRDALGTSLGSKTYQVRFVYGEKPGEFICGGDHQEEAMANQKCDALNKGIAHLTAQLAALTQQLAAAERERERAVKALELWPGSDVSDERYDQWIKARNAALTPASDSREGKENG
jgi:hypothetical protein